MKKFTDIALSLSVLIGCLLVLILAWKPFLHLISSERIRYVSPDKHYQLVVYAYPMLAAGPGQGGDAQGFVRLYGRNNKALHDLEVWMVQMVEEPSWGPHKVYLKLLGELPLDDD